MGTTSWTMIALLGTYHGLNPAMGWLLATALGLQERRATAVMRALPPIALGHAASVALILAVASVAELFVPADTLRWIGGVVLIGYATLLLVRRSHPRRVGMRLGMLGLVAWSFVMALSHGAGLMLLPAVLGTSPSHAHAHAGASAGLTVLAIHSVSMLIAMTAVALLAFRLSGVGLLRRVWIDTDAVWAVALAVSGVVVLVA
jgi:hypothetical protein